MAFPIRDNVARSQLRWMERQWATALADDSGRITAEQHLNAYSSVAAPVDIEHALAAVYSDQQHRFTAIHDRLHRAVFVDRGLSLLRAKMGNALDHRAALLARVATWYRQPSQMSTRPANADDQTVADTIEVDHAFSAQRSRWGERQPVPTPPAVAYAAATAAFAHLAHWLDQPTGAVVLASAAGDDLLRLNVDASKVMTTGVPGPQGYPVARQGYLAYFTGGMIWAVAPDGSGAPRSLARGDSLFAAADPRAVWVGDTSAGNITEVDGTGQILAGPLHPPGFAMLASSAGLVLSLQDRPGFEVWNPDGHIRCRTVTTANTEPFLLAARANMVVWAIDGGQLHLTDVTTCVDRILAGTINVNGPGYPDQISFSPDGRTLAVAFTQVDSGGRNPNPLQLFDVATGQVTMAPVTFSGIAVSAIAWTSDGSRLFWLYNAVTSPSSLMETWRLGDQAAQPLRIINVTLAPPLFVVP